MSTTPPPRHGGLRTLSVQGVGLVLGPLLFILALSIPLPGLGEAGRGALAVTLLMAVWWLTQAIPIPATALLPIVLLPLLSVAPSRAVVKLYADDAIFLFLGGFILAIAIEECGLHRRVALTIIRWFGTTTRRLSFSFMLVAAVASMWISNTATALMLLPMGVAVVRQVRDRVDLSDHGAARASDNFGALILLSIAYGASIGGLGTPIGTPPNILFQGQVASTWPERPDLQLSFFGWMVAVVPLVAVFLPAAWLLLHRVVFPCGAIEGVVRELRRDAAPSGAPLTRDEKVVAAVFSMTALFWILRRDVDLGFATLPGWADVAGLEAHVHDATVALFAATLLFLLPSEKPGARLLDWRVESKIPWGILILFGGGLAIAGTFKDTGLSAWFGRGFGSHLPDSVPASAALTALGITFLTEVTSNTATAAVLLPIAASVAEGAGLHPLTLMLPATISASCAFMLPVATPPNAIIFGSGRVTMAQMVRAGLLLNLAGVLLVTLFTLTWWRWLLGL